MDVNSDMSAYLHLIERHKNTLKQAKQRQGERPRDRKSREQTYAQFMMALMAAGVSAKLNAPHMMHTSFIPPAYAPSIAPLTALRGIAIAQLQLETHHRGRYMLLRAITPPRRMTAVGAVVVDEAGDAAVLQLYQQDEEANRAAADVVTVGAVLLLKEPFYKIMGDGEYGLRVDHVSDTVWLRPDDARVPAAWRPRVVEVGRSAEALKGIGNCAMKERRFWDAITDYTDALAQPATEAEIEILKRNRALAYLRTQHFDAALADTGFPTFHAPPPNEKALVRAAEALYSLGRFPESCAALQQVLAHFPGNAQAAVSLERAQTRVREQEGGGFDFRMMQAEARQRRPPHLEHATYVGPVEVRVAGAKGRGLFVTRAVEAGELLFCEKAFAHAFVAEGGEGKESGKSAKVSLLLNVETDRGFMGGQADLIRIIVQKLQRNPSLARGFTTLYHGDYEAVDTSEVDGMPVVDTFLVERIVSYNVFGSPLSSLASHTKSLTPQPGALDDDANHHSSCGIWRLASHINHSCTGSARRAFIGDMMVVRATSALAAGDEVTFWYTSLPDSCADAAELRERHRGWGFECECGICADAGATVVADLRRRWTGVAELKREFEGGQLAVGRVERVLGRMEGTYRRPAAEAPRLALWDPMLALARVYEAQGEVRKTLLTAGRVLGTLGFVAGGADGGPGQFEVVRWGLMVDHVVETFLMAKRAFEALGRFEDAGRAEGYARVAYKIVVGEEESFGKTYNL